jgi:preprotein translocase subunit SecF
VTGRVGATVGSADGESNAKGASHDDDVKTAAVLEPAGRLLTHPPRPRKKKRR